MAWGELDARAARPDGAKLPHPEGGPPQYSIAGLVGEINLRGPAGEHSAADAPTQRAGAGLGVRAPCVLNEVEAPVLSHVEAA
jgi:hypothetical protein